MSFLQAIYCIYLGHTKLTCNIFFHGFLVCNLKTETSYLVVEKLVKDKHIPCLQWRKQTTIKNETVQQIHDMNKNQCILSTLSTSIKQKLLINNFDTHM